jgi:hypothetical protein
MMTVSAASQQGDEKDESIDRETAVSVATGNRS